MICISMAVGSPSPIHERRRFVATGKCQNAPHKVNIEVVNRAGDFLRAGSGVGVVENVLTTDAMPLDAPCAGQLAGATLGVRAFRPVQHFTGASNSLALKVVPADQQDDRAGLDPRDALSTVPLGVTLGV
jgi:hypothetical protein